LVNERLRFLGVVVVVAVVPDRNEVLRRLPVDLRERAEPLQAVAHAIVQDVGGVVRAVLQFLRALRKATERQERRKCTSQQQLPHCSLPWFGIDQDILMWVGEWPSGHPPRVHNPLRARTRFALRLTLWPGWRHERPARASTRRPAPA